MKELSIEEKAKRYDDAINKAKSKIKNDKDHVLYENDILDIFHELKESEDEKIRKWIEKALETKYVVDNIVNNEMADKAFAWLEKQVEHARFIEAIQVGDQVTKNEDGVLVNLSQLKRVAKPSEQKQGEQKYIPKYKIGDYVMNTNYKGEPIYEIVYMDKECYICKYRGKERMGDKAVMHFSFDNPYLRLVQKSTDEVEPKFHEGDTIIHKELGGDYIHNPHKIIQVDILDKKYRLEGGLVAHFCEQDDYELVEQKPAWSEKDEKFITAIIAALSLFAKEKDAEGCFNMEITWLKSLKDRVGWKPSKEQMKALWDSIPKYVKEISEREMLLDSLYQDLKKLRGE